MLRSNAHDKQIIFRIPTFNITKSCQLFESRYLHKLGGKISPGEALPAHIEIPDSVIPIPSWGTKREAIDRYPRVCITLAKQMSMFGNPISTRRELQSVADDALDFSILSSRGTFDHIIATNSYNLSFTNRVGQTWQNLLPVKGVPGSLLIKFQFPKSISC